MGCNSYLQTPDPAAATRSLYLQFQYGFRREIEYALGDEIYWEAAELEDGFDTRADALVPAWEIKEAGARHFAITVKTNRIVGLEEISAELADRMFDEHFDGDSRHRWKS